MKDGSPEKLIVGALLQRFLPLARRRIETAQVHDGQYLRPSDPAYEQVLDSLAMVARHTPVPLLEALLRWRDRYIVDIHFLVFLNTLKLLYYN
ncbi:scaffold/adaptor protein [Lithospermum erythrorhizon]|uniref:Scaffold/adaptor protein n=1 Tax=Lithospermum erythrorhizon TaxID=34254 RepID=A0AAV3P4M7_LITER